LVDNGGFAGSQAKRNRPSVLQLQPFGRNDGKIGVLGRDGSVKYPSNISYDMGWQKLAKTYDSLSGNSLMIGTRTKNAVAYQN
jgi:hypothetical protein